MCKKNPTKIANHLQYISMCPFYVFHDSGVAWGNICVRRERHDGNKLLIILATVRGCKKLGEGTLMLQLLFPSEKYLGAD